MLRIIIADDHPVVLKGLKEIIVEHFDDATITENSVRQEICKPRICRKDDTRCSKKDDTLVHKSATK